ncbi:Pfs NACHT ankyrin domain-containing protein [Fusarium napiforme]|uniref:Pfs NACHT ankyrin domain-containing protein n=1 Tax=Fusarium napiforme TaxID=42672 RepID=A0A8H5IIJ0_9HYPO|nr:Pfs NACHT ankyrin domain-containing protein [Fusarium napiforme]
MAAILLDWKADTEIKDEAGWTPLHVSSLYGTDTIADRLLEREANPNAQPSDVLTPLHTAVDFGNRDVIKDIIKHGAQIINEEALSSSRIPAVGSRSGSQASRRDRCTQPTILPCKQAMIQPWLLFHCSNEAPIRALPPLTAGHRCYHGADITIPVERDGHRNTPVLRAAACHRPSKEKTAAGISLAHIAALHGHSDSLRLVLEYGTDANAADIEGRTPLHLAARHSHPECISLLQVHGADANGKANDRTTPLSCMKPQATQMRTLSGCY